MSADQTPWDIYVDEQKSASGNTLGFLVVPNTASFLHKLHRCRQLRTASGGSRFVWAEMHWNEPSLLTLEIAKSWIDVLFTHHGAKLLFYDWPTSDSKELIILKFLSRFCRIKRLSAPYNVVVFLDFDSDHAKHRIQDNVREVGRIARCYHLHSDNNDCLQCCDLLMGAFSYLRANLDIPLTHPDLLQKRERGERISDAQTKRLIAGHLALWMDKKGKKVYHC